jgi:hypothetical protein
MANLEDKIFYETLSLLRQYLYRRLVRDGNEKDTTLELDVQIAPSPKHVVDTIDAMCIEFERNFLLKSDILPVLLTLNIDKCPDQMEKIQKGLFKDGYTWPHIISLFSTVGFLVAQAKKDDRQFLAQELSFQVASYFCRDAKRFDKYLQSRSIRWECVKKEQPNISAAILGISVVVGLLLINFIY